MWGAIPTADGKCFDLQGIWISLAVWDVLSDVWIMGMAVPMVWKLHLRFREKVMLTGVFLLGAVVIVFSIMSCSAVVSSLQVENSQSNEYSFGLANLFQVLESNMGIIGACLPVMRQPLREYFPRIFGRSKISSGPSPYYGDRFTDQYAMQSVSSRQKGHNVTVSGPDLFRSAPRKSDELGIINEAVETGDRDSGGEMDGRSSTSQVQNAIRKNVVVSVDRE
ncbi:hypothetical protein LTR85_009327 [Meristemomyces frigidus]|nr:hypothetical protein LTR85_009327 [Meristemomyces frigidus]